eukprot:381475_1
MQWDIALPIDYTFKAMNAICLCILWMLFIRNMIKLQQHFRTSKHNFKQWVIHPDETTIKILHLYFEWNIYIRSILVQQEMQSKYGFT